MRKSKPLPFQTKITATLAMVAFGLICNVDVAQVSAQLEPKYSLGTQLAPRVGEIKGGQFYNPTNPTTDKLSSVDSLFERLAIPTKAKPKAQPPVTEVISRKRVQKAPTLQQKLAPLNTVSPKKNETSPAKTSADTIATIRHLPTDNLSKKTTNGFKASPQLPPPTAAVRPSKNEVPAARTSADAIASVANRPTENLSKKSTNSLKASPQLLPPTVIVRPSITRPDQLNQCVIEIGEIKSTNDVSLKVAIPDSVTMVEVIPNRTSNAARNFRIQMEQGVQLDDQSPAPMARQERQPQPKPQSQVVENSDTTPSVPHQAVPHVPHVPRTVPAGFAKNPFFVEKPAQAQDFRSAAAQGFQTPEVLVPQTAKAQVFQTPKAQVFQTPEAQSLQIAEAQSSTTPSDRFETSEEVASPQMPFRGVRSFFQRTSHSSPTEIETPQFVETAELSQQEQEPDTPQEKTVVHGSLPAKPVIAARIVGPANIDIGQTSDFMVAIVNPMNFTNRDLEIELDVPKGLEITLLERAADYNERTRTLVWKLDQIEPGEEVWLQYRVKSIRKGNQLQRVAIRINDELMEAHEVLTVAKLNLDAGASELPYE